MKYKKLNINISDGTKTLMVLEGCAQSQLACCILLRGGSVHELIRVKKIVKFMLLACYNWKLEKAFLADIEAVLPEPGMTFDDEIMDTEINNKENVGNVDAFDDKTSNAPINDGNSHVKDISGIFDSSIADNNDIFDSNLKDIDSDSSSKTSFKTDTVNGKESSLNIEMDDNSDPKTKSKKYLTCDTFDDENELEIEVKNSEVNEKNDLENDSKDVKICEKDDFVDDPLQRPKSYTKKTENLSCGVPIKDFSDPLRSTLSVDDDVFLPMEEAMLQADTQNDR